jgi:hypothetical protein
MTQKISWLSQRLSLGFSLEFFFVLNVQRPVILDGRDDVLGPKTYEW